MATNLMSELCLLRRVNMMSLERSYGDREQADI